MCYNVYNTLYFFERRFDILKKMGILLFVWLVAVLGSLYLIFGTRSGAVPEFRTINCRIETTTDDIGTGTTNYTIEYNIGTGKVLSAKRVQILTHIDDWWHDMTKRFILQDREPNSDVGGLYHISTSYDDYKRSITTTAACDSECQKERNQTLEEFKELFNLAEFICE